MMQGTSDPADESACSFQAQRPESVVHYFEAAWRALGPLDPRPSCQEFLANWPEPERSPLLRRLLAIELEYRQRHGEKPTPEEYYPIFPAAASLIQLVFTEKGLASRGGSTSAPGPTNGSRGSTQRDPSLRPRPDPDSTADHVPAAELEEVPPSGGLEDAPPNGGPPSNGAAEFVFSPAAVPLEKTGRQRLATTSKESPSSGSSTLLAGAADLPSVPGYEVLAELGRGGMGVVYKARHLQLQRLVALKMIHPRSELSPSRRERFLTEARAVARFQHPHLVQIYDIQEYDGRPYFSLELLEGGTLSRKLASDPQPAGAAAELVETLARAVDYAHQKGVLHRDLKPTNILLAADGTPKVVDFGLAKHLDADGGQTIEGVIIGTPTYMAPEQAWGETDLVGPAADIYSLGVILYEALTGRPPFHGPERSVTIRMVQFLDPVPPSRLVPQVPRDLELICLKCLEKQPHRRFASAGELAEELHRFREGRPIRTRPAPVWERAWKWARRRPALASLLVVSVLTLLSLVLLLVLGLQVAQHQLQEQERTAKRREQVQQQHVLAQQAADHNQLPQAQRHVQAALELIQAERTDLADLEPPLAALREELAQREAEARDRSEAVENYRRFLALRDEALFHGLELRAVDLPVNVAATKKACQDALALFGLTVDPPGGPVFPKHLNAEQRQKVTEACYELLLVWAEATAPPAQPGWQPPTAPQLEEALRLLDRADACRGGVTPPLPPTGAYHLRRARYLQGLGKEAEARQERQRAGTPRNALDYYLRADALQKEGRAKEAAEDFKQALQARPDFFWAGYFLAVCHLQLQKPELALANLTHCLGARKDLWSLYLFRGFANAQLENFKAAEKDYARALALQHDRQAHYGILVHQGLLRLRQARSVGEPAALPWPLALQPDLSFTCVALAQVQREQWLAEAGAYLEEASRQEPDQYPAYRYLALVQQQQRKFDAAEATLGQAIQTAQNREPAVQAQLYGQRARLYREWQKPDAAVKDLETALQTAATAEDHAERGRLLHTRQQYEGALTAYNIALDLGLEDKELYRAKAEALLALRREAEAAQALKQYLDRGGQPTAQLLRTRGLIRAQLRQFDDAVEDYSKALALQPDARTYGARGWLYLSKDTSEDLGRAWRDFEEAIRLEPGNADLYNGRGLVKARQGRYTEALDDVRRAQRQAQAPMPRMLWNSVHVYCEVGRYLAVNPTTQDPWSQQTRIDCQKQALDLLEKAFAAVPVAERADFWRRYVAKDPLLNPLRGSPRFNQLEQQYGRASRER